MRIIDRLRHQALIKNIPLGASPPKDNPLLKKQLEQTQKDLNLILNKWKFGDTPLKSAQEFLNNFEPWINRKIKEQGELKEFLNKHSLDNLSEIKQVNNETADETWKNTEQGYLRKIEELEKSKGTSTLSEEDQQKLTNYDDLVSDLDEIRRDKKTLEQEKLTLNNQLKNKSKEVSNKDKALANLDKTKKQSEIYHQKQLKEKNGLITTLNQEIKQYKEKYTKQGKLLDTEQLECKKLETKIEELQTKISELETERKEHIKLLEKHHITVEENIEN